MGYRLHYAKTYKVEWDGGFFSGDDVEKIDRLLRDHCEESFWTDEYSDIWEVGKKELKQLIAKLRAGKIALGQEYNIGESGAELADIFQTILDGSEPSEDYIRIEWF